MVGLYTNYEGAWGLRVKCKQPQTRVAAQKHGVLHGLRSFEGRN